MRVILSFDEGDQEPVRIAAHPVTGRLYVLGGGGDVNLLDAEAGTKRRIFCRQGLHRTAQAAGCEHPAPGRRHARQFADHAPGHALPGTDL